MQVQSDTSSEEVYATTNAPTSTTESIKSFLAGGFGGVAAVLVGESSSVVCTAGEADGIAGHPFDLTKTRLQTAPPGSYTGALDVVKKTIARDGPTGYVRINHDYTALLSHSQSLSRRRSTITGCNTYIRSIVLGVCSGLAYVTKMCSCSFRHTICRRH